MDSRSWEKLYENAALHRYMWRAARKKTRLHEVKEDCVQFAWLQIGLAPAGKSVWYYQDVARTAINTEYNRYWRYWRRKQRAIDTVRKWAEDAQEVNNDPAHY